MADFSSLISTAASKGGALDASSVAELKNALEASGKTAAPAKQAALQAVVDMAPNAESQLVALLPTMLSACADKVKEVQGAAYPAVKAVVEGSSVYATKLIMPSLLKSMDSKEKFQTIVSALNALEILCKKAPEQSALHMNDLVPIVSDLMSDAKKQVKEAAQTAMVAMCATIRNKDLDPLLPVIIEAIKNMDSSTECVHELAATTFVQNVTTAALAIVVPLLLRGFKQRAAATKRQCAVIVTNMSKLVEDPAEAMPFLPALMPELAKASEEVSDPEARTICARAHSQLTRIQNHFEKAPPPVADAVAIAAMMKPGAKNAAGIDYAANIACTLCDLRNYDKAEWESALKKFIPAAAINSTLTQCAKDYTPVVVEDEVDDGAEELCNCNFTLAYGSKILLHNTHMKLKRGYRYGLLGGNDSGKTTLMRSIANGQVEGFPPATELKTVFVEADIQGEQSHLCCLEYIFFDENIKAMGSTKEEVSAMLLSVGFTEKMLGDGVTTLSGGWRMKLALARAMLQKADILLMDEPTNHLDVMNVAWVQKYLLGLTNVTAIIVSHDSGLLDNVCSHILQIEDLKLHMFKGNLSDFVKLKPEAKAFFELKSDKLKFTFPQPGYIEGVKSKGKPLMKMDNVTYTYPINDVPTVADVTVRVSLASRVACVGPNGAGKSTMIKLLTGEIEPEVGDVWKHPNARVAYVAQHAFHHIEKHLNKTANEYIRWRYNGGDDKEALVKDTMVLTEEEEARIRKPIAIKHPEFKDKNDNPIEMKLVIEKLTGIRRESKKVKEYEVKFHGRSDDMNIFLNEMFLEKNGFEKLIKNVDEKIAARAGLYQRPLTQANVEKHLEDVGLDKEFGTHYRMKSLSGGQKVKVVIAASMWNQPHILILDEPTNYLDRESLGALAGAIREFEGGVVMITHNNQFCSALCPETWVMEKNMETGIARLDCQGDAAWMENVMKEKVEFKQVEETVDALGNTVKVKAAAKKLNKKEERKLAKLKAARKKAGIEEEDDDDWGEQ